MQRWGVDVLASRHCALCNNGHLVLFSQCIQFESHSPSLGPGDSSWTDVKRSQNNSSRFDGPPPVVPMAQLGTRKAAAAIALPLVIAIDASISIRIYTYFLRTIQSLVAVVVANCVPSRSTVAQQTACWVSF